MENERVAAASADLQSDGRRLFGFAERPRHDALVRVEKPFGFHGFAQAGWRIAQLSDSSASLTVSQSFAPRQPAVSPSTGTPEWCKVAREMVAFWPTVH
jgi:hypothetical protein